MDVRVRVDRAEVGLALRVRVSDAPCIQVLRVLCAEVKLGEPVGAKRLVDDGSGRDFGGSIEVARRQLAKGEIRCVRVPGGYD